MTVPVFTREEAQSVLADLAPVLEEVLRLRADTAELAAAVRTGTRSPLGGLAELKGLQARLDDALTTVQESGAELRSLAPLLLDFSSALDGEPVLLCWLEGEAGLGWYHRHDLGIAGRRRLP